LLKITSHDLKTWADEQELSDLLFAELDYRLVKILDAIYHDDFLSKRLYLKGGTAINKLYLKETSRLSVDLDFNHIGAKEEVLKERQAVRERICKVLEKHDEECITHSKHRYEQTTIKARYKTLSGPTKSLKIEISHVERFPILPPVQKQVKTPDGNSEVTTYTLEELTSTKLRALMERSKGRDIYDLYFISQLKPDPTITRKMFLYYFYRSRKVFNPKIHYQNLTKRYQKSYVDDVSAFVKPTVAFDLGKAPKEVISAYSFLNELDSNDEAFLKLSALLLGRKIPKKDLVALQKVEKPLILLFDGTKISETAANISADEIKLFVRGKHKTGQT
jgi:predicted nucleotidyltransferase component of viral defense system